MTSSESLRLASKRLPLLPQRQIPSGPRNGSQLTSTARQVSDTFYRCAVEIAKLIYVKVDSRYPFTSREDDAIHKLHQDRMDDAKKILNEARNDVVEAVLPLFDIQVRNTSGTTEGDQAAHDYIVKNIFDHMVKTFKAYTDLFVEPHEVVSHDNLLDKVASVQRERLESWLVNFTFVPKDLSVKTDQIRKGK